MRGIVWTLWLQNCKLMRGIVRTLWLQNCQIMRGTVRTLWLQNCQVMGGSTLWLQNCNLMRRLCSVILLVYVRTRTWYVICVYSRPGRRQSTYWKLQAGESSSVLLREPRWLLHFSWSTLTKRTLAGRKIPPSNVHQPSSWAAEG
jgi:hypothetical protein